MAGPQRDVVAITDLKANAADLVRSIDEDGRTVVVTQNGEPKVVVMGIDVYRRWRDAMALLKIVAQSEHAFEEGRAMDQDEAFERARSAIRRARTDG